MATTLNTDWRELAGRSADGLDVRLWWRRSTGRVQITIADHRGGDHAVIDVDATDALDAFRHPFAYTDGGGRSQRHRRELSVADGREGR